ncbi:MAG TPA: ABC transporter substrate-binding protein [Candidatus Dormibacteraeota bacterium]|nr:ABC transporter substrate-binding protein [Candidatus Dormibacteraeota bacterium]
MKVFIRALLSGVLFVLGMAAGSPGLAAGVQGASPGSIDIGVQVSLTGPASSIGQGFKAGTQLAADEINAHGGINGRKIHLVFEDDAGTAAGGILAVRRLMEQDGVFAIFGGGVSTSTASVIPLVQQSQFLYYDSLASDPRVLEHYSPYVFSGATVVRADVTSYLADVMKQDFKAKRVATLTSDEGYCTSGMTLLKPKIVARGMDLVSEQTFQSGDIDFSAQGAALKAAKPDVIYLCGVPADGGRMIPQLRRDGVTAKFLGDPALADPVTIEGAGKVANGFYAPYEVSKDWLGETSGAMAEWKARFAKAFPHPAPGTPNSFSLAAYSDFFVFAEGIRRAGSEVTPDRVIAGLDSLRNFVGGKTAAWSYAVPIGTPRTFKKGDHKGSGERDMTLLIVRDGAFARAKGLQM